MAFFQRVMNYLLNEVVVNALANSKTFQRFAIRTNSMFTETAKKAVEQQGEVVEKGAAFWTAFRQEMTKGMRDIQNQQGGRR